MTKEGTRRKVRIGSRIKTTAINSRNAPSVIFIQLHKADRNFFADIGNKSYIDIRNRGKVNETSRNSSENPSPYQSQRYAQM